MKDKSMNTLQEQIEQKLKQTGLCQSLHLRMSYDDCEAMRKREDVPLQCASCPGLNMNAAYMPAPRYAPNLEEKAPLPVHAQIEAAPKRINSKPGYTAKDIAKQSNVSDAYVHNLHYLVRKSKPLPNSPKTKAVLNTLKELGISWDDIVKVQGWKNANIKQAVKCLAKQAVKQTSPKIESLEIDVTKMLKDIEQPQTLQDSKLINDIMDRQEEDFTKPQPECWPPIEPTIRLSELPLEALLAEITRRLPRAELVLK